ncbi:MAG: hypothetical protein F9K36_06540, partial [Burkholderiaceae bacterium]
MPNAVSTYLTFANLQMAAEAIYPVGFTSGPIPASALTTGNSRSNKFTPTQAAQFVQEWRVLDHRANTGTGFSGTLFEYIGTNTDPSLGPVSGQRVVSLRSTEFVDDAVRDSQATNDLEIFDGGWAIGQIADMKAWFDSLNADPTKLQGHYFSITGYSLGGHLATALNLLYPDLATRITATYTFNGAGVGRVNPNTSLLSVVEQFNALRGSAASAFSDPAALAAYFDLRSRYVGGTVATTPEAIAAITGERNALLSNQEITNASERSLLYDALGRIKTIMEEAARIASFGSGLPDQPPLSPVTSNVEAVNLDYQIAVLQSQRSTVGTNRFPILGRQPGDFPIPDFIDVYGYTSPSLVAISQLHYGSATPVFIEDQPLFRGTVVWDIATQSAAYRGAKFLQEGFAVNDFGDTHSLVLLVDSLSLQNALASLDPNVQMATLSSILQAASSATESEQPGGQGKSEGDVLERTLDALRRMLLDPAATATPANLDGGTWANIDARTTFHQQLKALVDDPKFTSIKGKVTVSLSNATHLRSAAKTDFAAFLALQALSPFTLSGAAGQEPAVESILAGGAMASVYAAWSADKALTPAERAAGVATFSDRYYSDRADLIGAVIARNLSNAQGVVSAAQFGSVPVPEQTIYSDAVTQTQLVVGGTSLPPDLSIKKQVWFGGDLSEAKFGSGRNDRLYGGGNNDTLQGLGGADHLEGNTGNDSLLGGDGTDTLVGGAGDDTLSGEADNDSLLGGSGTDTYTFTANWGHDTVVDTDAAGVIQVQGLGQITGAGASKIAPDAWQTSDQRINYTLVPIDGTRNDLYITFSDRTDVITLRNWSDGLSGIALEQAIQTSPPPPVDQTVVLSNPPGPGGANSNFAVGSTLAYEIIGTDEGDSIQGGNAGDRIEGRADGDRLYGHDGDDRLYAEVVVDLEAAIAAAQTAQVPVAADVLEGGRGNDMLIGGASNWQYGGAGRDSLIGGSAVDLIQGDTFDGGFSNGGIAVATHFDYDEAKRKYYYYASETAGAQTAYYARLGSLDAGGDADVIVAGAGDDVADGELGNDELSLGEGSDIGVGSAGSDSVYGGADNDLLFGDFNADESTPSGAEPAQWQLNYAGLAGALHASDLLVAGDGDDLVWGNGGDDFVYGGSGADRLRGDDFVTPVGYHGDDYLDGGAGNDELAGDAGDDELFGGEGDDSLFGDDVYLTDTAHGDDYLDGEAGNDNLIGQGGADVLFGGTGNDSLFGDADDTALAQQGSDTLDGEEGDDYLRGYGGADEMWGGAGADQLIADAGDDIADGGEGADILNAGDGNDWLGGGSGDDVLTGDAGDDTLVGGAGADYLDGGSGSDTYRISAADTSNGLYRDTLRDASGADALELEGVALSSITVALQSGGLLELGFGPQKSVLIEQGLTSSLGTVLADGEAGTLQQLVNQRLGTSVTVGTTSPGGRVLGGAAADVITVNHGATQVAAGGGDDTIDLRTDAGATVLATAGQGMDQVLAMRRNPATPEAQNVLALDATIDAAVLRIYQTGATSYVLALDDQGDGIRFNAGDGSAPVAAADWPFDTVRLADGSSLPWQQIVDRGIVPPPAPATAGGDVRQLTPLGDTYYGLDGDDSIEGLAGADTLSGDAGNDTLIGGAGNDVLHGGSGYNTLLGGDGADQLQGGLADAYDVADGGEGNDSYTFRLGSGIFVDGEAHDRSATSDDVYTVSGSQIGGAINQRWTISDDGGNDRLALNHSLVTAANTTVRYTGTGLSLRSWNLEVQLDGAVTPDGMVDPAKGIETVSFFDGTSWSATQMLAMTLQATAGGDSIRGYSGADALDGGAGNDALWGGAGNDTLQGGAGGDTLRGEAGNDVLSAGPDGGTLLGGGGDDSYRVSRGDGTVFVGAAQRGSADNNGSDTLQLDVDASEVTFSVEQTPFTADEDYLVVRWSDGSATAKLLLEGSAATGLRGAVEGIRFADGSSLSLASVLASAVPATTAGNDNLAYKSSDDVVSGGDGHDTLNGRGGNDRLDGDNGNDQLSGASGDDTLAGGAGNDRLDGGGGANTIEFGAGGGQDQAVALGSGSNALALTGAISPASVTVSWQFANYQGNDSNPRAQWSAGLKIALAGGVDYVVSDVGNYVDFTHYDSSRFGVHSVQFVDGTRWDVQALVESANRVTPDGDLLFDAAGRNLLAGGDGDDRLYGLDGGNRLEGQSGNDTLFGGDFDDTLVGGTGDDVYYGDTGLNTIEYALGDGNDGVGFGGSTRVQFGAGIAAADVSVGRSTFGALDLRVNGGGSLSIGVPGRSSGLDGIAFADGTTWTAAQAWDLALAGTPADDHIVGFDAADDTVSGAGGADTLEGGTGSDLLDGGTGDDVLYAAKYGDAGMPWYQDTLVGAGGNDTLVGATGAMTYRFDPGFGNDRIEWTAGRDLGQTARVVFGSGIAPADIRVSRSAFGLVLSKADTGDTVHIANFFTAVDSTDLRGDRPIDRVEFDDGTVWLGADLVARLTQALTAADDLFYGSAGADTLDAMAGHDRIFAGGGNDLVLGGAGDDLLRGDDGDDTLAGGVGWDNLDGGAGSDRFEFGSGDGSERVIDSAGAADVLAFGAGVAAASVQVVLGVPENPGQGYRLNLVGGSDTVYIAGIEQVQFDDGTQWSLAQIDLMARTLSGTPGNDVLSGTVQADRLLGLAGNDTLSGLAGDDLLDGGAGNDSMAGGQGNDTYVVDSASDIVSEASGQGTDL